MAFCTCALEETFINSAVDTLDDTVRSAVSLLVQSGSGTNAKSLTRNAGMVCTLFEEITEDVRQFWQGCAACDEDEAHDATRTHNSLELRQRLIYPVTLGAPTEADKQALVQVIEEHRDNLKSFLTPTPGAKDYARLLLKLFLLHPRYSSLIHRSPAFESLALGSSDVKSDFALPFFGQGDLLLQGYILNANKYMKANTESVYSKSFPILQSSGTGKTKLAVQLSALQAGFLVCTRDKGNEDRVSFPPRDDLVCEFLAFQGRDDMEKHKRPACWLSAYLEVLADALEKRMLSSGCFEPRKNSASLKSQHSDVSKCWQKIVHHLAVAIHGGPDFIQRYTFETDRSSPTLFCEKSALNFDSPNDPDSSFGTIETSSGSQAKKDLRYRTHLLVKIDKLAKSKFDEADSAPRPLPDTASHSLAQTSKEQVSVSKARATPDAGRGLSRRSKEKAKAQLHAASKSKVASQPPVPTSQHRAAFLAQPESKARSQGQIAREIVAKYIQQSLDRLENLLPKQLAESHFFFLVIDEILPVSRTLPYLRRLWREANPKHTWLMFIDTDSQVAPLAGAEVRMASLRLDANENLLVIPPFVQLPFDAAFRHEFNQERKEAFWKGVMTFRDQLQLLSCFGRPLWHAKMYRFTDDPPRPNLASILVKLLVGKTYPYIWPSLSDSELGRPDSSAFQAIMAIVAQRLPLHFVGHQGVHMVPSSSSALNAAPSNLQAGPTGDFSTPPTHRMTSSQEQASTAFLQQQATKHLRVISKVHDNVNFFVTCTVSEPALSLAVASLLRNPFLSVEHRVHRLTCAAKWSQIVTVLVQAHRAVGLMLGEEGEEGVRLLCSLAADLVAEERAKRPLPEPASARELCSFSAVCDPISLRDWLSELLGAHQLDSELLAWSANYYLNFTHFLRLPTYVYSEPARKSSRLDIMALAEYWWRQGAICGQQNQPGWDLLIPIYHSKSGPPNLDDKFDPGDISYVAIQVKNRKSDVEATRFFGPSLKEGRADRGVDPKLGFENDFLEIFIDLRSPESRPHRFEQLIPIVSVTPKENEQLRPPLSRRHLTVRGSSEAVFPVVGKLTKDAQAGLPLLFGNAEPSLSAMNPRQDLLASLKARLTEFEQSDSLLNGDAAAYAWDPRSSTGRKRGPTKIGWA